MDRIVQDLKLAARRLLKDRGFAGATIATLALCLAANAAIFTIVNAVLLRPLPYPDSDRLVTVFNTYPGAGSNRSANSVPDYFDRVRETDAFEEIGLYTWAAVTIGGQGQGEAEHILGMTVTPSFFHTLRVQPLRGRLFGESDGEVGQQRKVILTEGLWQRLFPGRTDVAGAELRINSRAYAVVGVMPSSFRFDPDSQLWMPAAFSPEDRADNRRHSNGWQMIARLVPGATLARAQAQIDVLNARNLERFPQMKQILINARFHTRVVAFQDDLVRATKPMVLLLWGGVLLVLIIGCVNVANLGSVRASARSREIATRLSLGTTTSRLVQQMITESLLLSTFGGAAGLVLARWMLQGIQSLGLDALRGKEIVLDWQTMAYTFLLITITGTVVGMWPMLARRTNLADVVREEGRSGTPTRHARAMRRILVTSQVALALVLLMGAGLLLASFERVLDVDLGFRPDRVLTGDILLPAARYTGETDMRPPAAAPASVRVAADRILAELRTVPGVVSAGLTTAIPFGGTYSDSVIVAEGYRLASGESLISPSQVRVSEDYFESMGATLVAGRFFDARDIDTAPRVLIVDEPLARGFWPDADPIGRRMYFPRGVETGLAPPPEDQWFTIVGVVKEMRLQGIASDTGSGLFGTYFLPFRQFPARLFTLAIKTERDPLSVAGAVRAVIARMDPELAFSDVRPMDALVERALVDRRTPMLLAIGFAVVALVLCAIGIYGVLAFEVRLRTREIAIRMAVGAEPSSILRMVLGEGAVLVAAGALAGLGGSFLLRRSIESQLYQVRATDPVVLSAVAGLLLLVATLACALPARRAMSTNPSVALADQ
jgi:putative ABC transport system permease protein